MIRHGFKPNPQRNIRGFKGAELLEGIGRVKHEEKKISRSVYTSAQRKKEGSFLWE